MFSEIRINNDYASLITADGDATKSEDICRKNLLRTPEFLSKLVQAKHIGKSIFHNILPENCRYMKPISPDHLLLIVEEQPSIRTILINCDITREIEKIRQNLDEYGYNEQEILDKYNRLGYASFTLAFPYIVSVIVVNELTFSGMQVFVRKQPLFGLQDILFHAPLYNIPANQWICIGDTPTPHPASSLTGFVRQVNTSFWNNKFNYDYLHNMKLYSEDPTFSSFLTWQHQTSQDPMFVFSKDYKPYKSVSDTIREIEERYGVVKKFLSYGDFHTVFTTPKKEEIKSKKKSIILYADIVTSYFIADEEISVGDDLQTADGTILYVDSFLGFDLIEQPEFIRLIKNKKPVILKLHHKAKQFLKQCIERIRYKTEVQLPNGVVIKPNDYIAYDVLGKRIIKLVKYIRKAPDNKVEIRTGDGYYSLESIPKNTYVFDITNIDFHGLKLNQDDLYVTLHTYSAQGIFAFSYCKFKEINITSSGSISFKFATSRTKNIERNQGDLTLGSTEPKYRLMKEDELIKLPNVTTLGRKLITISDGWSNIEDHCFSYKGRFVFSRDHSFNTPNIDQLYSTLLKDESFELQTPSIKINFSIGDKVVVSNWQNPLEMLKIKTITGIISERANANINFALTDKQGNLSTIKYVEGGSAVHIGKVRRIENQYNDLKSGTKIVANETGIPCFPKKDVNIIIGFIIDSGASEPFVLCSNGCTLWYSDVIKKFKIIEITNKKWKSLQHAPIDTSKIKLQPGDIINCKGSYHDAYGYIVMRQRINRTLKLMRGATCRHDDAYYFDSTIKRTMYLDCIPEPRANMNLEDIVAAPLQPTLHGTYVSLEDIPRDAIFIAPRKGILNNV